MGKRGGMGESGWNEGKWGGMGGMGGGNGGKWRKLGGMRSWSWSWTTPNPWPHTALTSLRSGSRALRHKFRTPAASPCSQSTRSLPAVVAVSSSSCGIQGLVTSICVCSSLSLCVSRFLLSHQPSAASPTVARPGFSQWQPLSPLCTSSPLSLSLAAVPPCGPRYKAPVGLPVATAPAYYPSDAGRPHGQLGPPRRYGRLSLSIAMQVGPPAHKPPS